ncbi:hypothetical protein ACIBTV_27865 [Micromonospora sp. NPDC049366]|uniref:hypothetical protein n=1 Tax=Micromonospora sp. NPDC049366 TaxID=3364271 RepID=UPI003796ED8A
MATEVAPPTRWLADQWENNCGYASAVLSGIVPDERHKKSGGYHPSIEDLVRYGNGGDYSNKRALDKAPPVTAKGKKYGAAVDMSMSRADMKKLYGRALAVYNNRSDPRRKYLNAINVWDGIDGHSPRRLDFQANTNTTASADHTWHSHEDQPRAYVDVNRNEQEAWTAARAFISMAKGETAAAWLAGQGEDDMTPEQDQRLKRVETMLSRLDGREPIGQTYLRLAVGKDDVVGAKPVAHPTLTSLGAQLTDVQKVLGALAAQDFTDEPAIIAGILAGLTPEKIAAAIPATMAKQVADDLARRLAA